jgi:hypothetical protein
VWGGNIHILLGLPFLWAAFHELTLWRDKKRSSESTKPTTKPQYSHAGFNSAGTHILVLDDPKNCAVRIRGRCMVPNNQSYGLFGCRAVKFVGIEPGATSLHYLILARVS